MSLIELCAHDRAVQMCIAPSTSAEEVFALCHSIFHRPVAGFLTCVGVGVVVSPACLCDGLSWFFCVLSDVAVPGLSMCGDGPPYGQR